MKGRDPRARTIVVISAALLLIGCGGDSAEAVLPAETVVQVDSELVATEVTPVVVSTAAPTTLPATTLAPTTVPATTAAPTVVETLPTPVAPPPPRSDEPYIELGTIEIPALEIVAPLLEGISLNTLDLGPGHWPGTAMPGSLGNVVIAGHRTSHGKVFRHIDQLVVGDEVIFTTADGRYVYLVTETTVVQPDALYIIEQTEAHTATLFACHPPGSTRQRIVVHLELQS